MKAAKAIKVHTTIGKIKFRGNPDRGSVDVRCKGFPTLRIRRSDDGLWEVPGEKVKVNGVTVGTQAGVLAKTAKAAYQQALKRIWVC